METENQNIARSARVVFVIVRLYHFHHNFLVEWSAMSTPFTTDHFLVEWSAMSTPFTTDHFLVRVTSLRNGLHFPTTQCACAEFEDFA
jgi:hypothetical protein